MPLAHTCCMLLLLCKACRDAVQEDFGRTPEKQQELLRSMIKGWTVGTPPFQEVLAANKPGDLKLSKIYQRCGTTDTHDSIMSLPACSLPGSGCPQPRSLQ